ncbi:helix-turn-helix domain-containing protein [Fibrella forsythiae]|uniref:Helix-turn-helix transcriptional regulator n=1 Tax=Fibrella forsythiae TaxID=2817061 RepID=A0ABS3JJ01_9BACT|nr:helix-turn-helix transcriptional regulator [Fibrella forsythiae]MBO0949214.1 helix-turn-helix transcriptional regulator [Fibrella forsythiae]
MENTPPPTVHHGRNVKRIREMLGIKQEFLASSLGLSQQAVSQLEQKEVLDQAALQKASKALGIAEGVIENFNDEAAINIVANTINNHDQASVVNYYPTFNPIDKIVELYNDKIALYERILAIEREKNELLQRLLDPKQ